MTTENPNHNPQKCAAFGEAYLAAAKAPVNQVERGRLLRLALVAHNPAFRAAFNSLPDLQPI